MATNGLRWGLAAGAGVLLVGGVLLALNWPRVDAWMTAGRLKAATTDEARTAEAAKLIAAGEMGRPFLLEALRRDDPDTCDGIATVFRNSDLRTVTGYLSAAETLSPAGRIALLNLIPSCLEAGVEPATCQQFVRTCLAGDGKVRAIGLCLHPRLGMKAEVVPLLKDASAEVRRAAMMAVGPSGPGGTVIEAEELFRWLHDPDPEVRLLCEAALGTRDLEPEQIEAGRKLTHPDTIERLKLLADILRDRTGPFREPSQWLERLSRDADPAVRAGVARVACARKVRAAWLDALCTRDPDPTVREIARFHRAEADTLPAGFRE